ncbi:outer membrane protein assembly factor BamD [Psychroserpens sp.]|uniref:outer membrane protein assembly factor BamD n=1 Tax=Psychroserpens sp. TaxID=2020870 RepID=UPI001AFFDC12|nr:outer membrane protein assembly factor BamD [Psychroserpens sp.]MBO6606801.1 outer membrane protein assembly factor BamD [Psychroserpens sp.]MBO6632144.1 outer membrane protein assembly factor BamD [Psychroserpens sp.]MBO6653504.1 outer membrane protein assembly factor BamD [Psychroserpens sp.]MBO6680468.1 outer membrane protein assembly factor BamD [Psychroserpens sp.]MBO6750573.1 outer membrane protein assembly factor BamD [Psychroserpens sp.]
MKKLVYIVFILLVVSSCSEFQKALRSEDIGVKFNLGTELYEAGKWSKANRLFKQIEPNYRGKPQAEKLSYMYAKTFFEMRSYIEAAYKLDQFERLYPNSEKVQEAAFLAAKSFYYLSPVYSKEQHETVEALQKLQLFVNKYPESEYLPQANTLINELDYKLERKAFEIAKQYNSIAYFESSDYIAAIKAFDNFLADFPGTSFREQAMFYRLDSAYKLGINSIDAKKEERLNTAINYFKSFTKFYPNSEFTEQANKMNEEMTVAMQQYNTQSK